MHISKTENVAQNTAAWWYSTYKSDSAHSISTDKKFPAKPICIYCCIWNGAELTQSLKLLHQYTEITMIFHAIHKITNYIHVTNNTFPSDLLYCTSFLGEWIFNGFQCYDSFNRFVILNFRHALASAIGELFEIRAILGYANFLLI